MTARKNPGSVVRTKDGRLGIVYDSDQKKEFEDKNHPMEKYRTVLVTMVDQTYSKLDEPKRIIRASTLRHIGFVD